MECSSCMSSLKSALTAVEGVSKFDIDLENQRVSITGSCPPSSIIQSIQSIGKDAIIRGTGAPNSAAVCILESFLPQSYHENPVRGLARIVSVGPDELLFDVTVNGVEKGIYHPSIRESGNISNGSLSTGKAIHELQAVEVNTPSDFFKGLYKGQAFFHTKLGITDLIGRSMILSQSKDKIDPSDLAGVIARSAGVWENEKQVCSCTGKTVWQERFDAKNKGIDEVSKE